MTEDVEMCSICKKEAAHTKCLFCDSSLCVGCEQESFKLQLGGNLGKNYIGMCCRTCKTSLLTFVRTKPRQTNLFKDNILELITKHLCINNLTEDER